MNELISIVVPIYNAEKYLKDCIESILSQTYKNLELILVNDGSKDDSLNICNYYKNIDHRVIVVNKQNEGVSAARNLGIELARGDFIGFVDSDDYIQPKMYETLLNKIKIDNTQVCAMTAYTINRTKNIRSNSEKMTISGEDALKHLLLLEFPTSLWAYLYSNDILKGQLLNNQIHFFEDFEYNYRILTSVTKVSICSQKLYHYRVNESSTNNQQINNKRMSCLTIYNMIYRDLKNKHSKLKDYAMYFRAHCFISIISSISKSRNIDASYYKVVKKNDLFEITRSRYVPLSYKAVILMFSLCPYSFTKLLYYLRYR